MSKINLYTKNGGVSANERQRLQRAMNTQLRDGSITELLETTDKEKMLVIELGDNERGEVVYGTIELGISTVHPDNKPKPTRKTKEKETVEPETFVIG